MPPPQLLDLSKVDLDALAFGVDGIEAVNPHRYEMRQLDGIIYYDTDEAVCLGYKDITENEFWVRGHIPGRPLMPGVVMVEAAAQLASFFVIKFLDQYGPDKFIGFGGIEDVKFRGSVTCGDRLYLVVKMTEARPRRFMCDAQGIVDGRMCFQARIIGMPI